MCNTCEKRGESGWSQGADVEPSPKQSIEEEAASKTHYSFRRRRRLESEESASRNQSPTPDVNLRPHVAKRTPSSLTRFRNTESSLAKSPLIEPRSLNFPKRKKGSPLKTENSAEVLADADTSRAQEQSKLVMESLTRVKGSNGKSARSLRDLSCKSFADAVSSHPSPVSSVDMSRRGSISTTAEDGNNSTDATSVDEDTIIVHTPSYLAPTIPAAKTARGCKVSDVLEQAKSAEAIIIGPSTSLQHPAVEVVESAPESVLTDLDNTEMEVLDQSLPSVASGTPSKRGRKKKRKFEEDTIEEPATEGNKRSRCIASPTPEASTIIRIPGDYKLTPVLLAQPESKWINCSICEESFVQEDAYFTRSSCPRCERHSKLYGYMWPKTDKESRDDSEERVLDHRTVHRFIRPDEERSIRKKNHAAGSRAVSQAIIREPSEPVEVVEIEEEEITPKVRSRRGRPLKRSRKTM